MVALALFDTATAEALTAATTDGEGLIEPRLVLAGDHAGLWAASAAILSDMAFAAHAELLALATVVDIDPSVAWPSEE